jgi:hypothetical protein
LSNNSSGFHRSMPLCSKPSSHPSCSWTHMIIYLIDTGMLRGSIFAGLCHPSKKPGQLTLG